PDLDVAVPGGVDVVLQRDGARVDRLIQQQLADAGGVVPAFLDRLAHRGRVQAGVDDLDAVEPVLDVVTAQDDARAVPFAHRTILKTRHRRHAVQRGGAVARAAQGVGVLRAVDDLVFKGHRVLFVAPAGADTLTAGGVV